MKTRFSLIKSKAAVFTSAVHYKNIDFIPASVSKNWLVVINEAERILYSVLFLAA